MTEKAQNHYQVLGLERTADERAIKKAYFGLVRKFPPDTHAEDFKRIREAYEVLSDPVARQRFDNAEKDFTEYGDDVAAVLREVEEATKLGDEALVQGKLAELVAEHPDVLVARENLAASYSRSKAFAEALAHLDALVEKAPEHAKYHLHRGAVLRSLERQKEAEAALRRAHELAPDDVAIHATLVDLLAQKKDFDAALRELDEASSKHAPGSALGVQLALRRIDLLFACTRRGEAQERITELLAEVSRSDDPEMPKYVSSQLASVAAGYFARKEFPAANSILRRCEEIYPDSPVDHPYPAVVTLPLGALPKVGQEWLAKLTPGPDSATQPRDIWVGPAFSLLGAAAVATLASYLLFASPRPWGAGGLIFAAVVVAIAVAALSASAYWIARILTSPIRAFVTLHPLYLIEARAQELKLYSLFHLSDVRAVHHHTNGAYSHSIVSLIFGPQVISLRFAGQGYAQGWLQYMLECRHRSLELMAEGYLEAENGVELIPPALVTRPPEALMAAERAAKKRWILGSAALAAALWALAIPLHARGADDALFRAAVRKDTLAAYDEYLAAAPGGRHAADAEQRRAIHAGRAAAVFRGTSDPHAPNAEVLLEALAALSAAGMTTVPVFVEVKAHGDRAEAGDLQDRRAEALAGHLNQVFETAGLSPWIAFAHSAQPPGASVPAALVVHHEARVTSADPPVFELESRIVFRVKGVEHPWPTSQQKGALRPFAATEALPLAPGREGLTQAASAAFDAFGWKLVESLGLGGAASVVRYASASSHSKSSPYHR